MNLRNLLMIMPGVSCAAVFSAQAAFYTLEFTGTDGTVASGWLDVNSSDIAIAGSLNVSSSLNSGTYAFYPGLRNGALQLSPSGSFLFDNIVPVDTIGGLQWVDASHREMNLWSNGDGTYTLYGWAQNNGVPYGNGFSYAPESIGTLSLVDPVPEPATFAFGALLLLPLVATTFSCSRKFRMALSARIRGRNRQLDEQSAQNHRPATPSCGAPAARAPATARNEARSL
jgi:hypothetical protein